MSLLVMLLLDALASFLWPPVCPRCLRRGRVDELCGMCRRGLPRTAEEERWRVFERRGVALRCASIFFYEDPVRRLLLEFKYRSNRHAGRGLERLLVEDLPGREALGWPDAVLWVPMAWRRRRARGFNQARILAQRVAGALDLPLAGDVLRRRGGRAPQVGLPGRERRRNLESAFSAREVPGRSFLLVDDVVTTGSTLLACAGVLVRAGARRVTALTLCRTP